MFTTLLYITFSSCKQVVSPTEHPGGFLSVYNFKRFTIYKLLTSCTLLNETLPHAHSLRSFESAEAAKKARREFSFCPKTTVGPDAREEIHQTNPHHFLAGCFATARGALSLCSGLRGSAASSVPIVRSGRREIAEQRSQADG